MCLLSALPSLQRQDTEYFVIPDSPDSTPPPSYDCTDSEHEPPILNILPRTKLIRLLILPHDGIEETAGPYAIEPSQLVRRSGDSFSYSLSFLDHLLVHSRPLSCHPALSVISFVSWYFLMFLHTLSLHIGGSQKD